MGKSLNGQRKDGSTWREELRNQIGRLSKVIDRESGDPENQTMEAASGVERGVDAKNPRAE